MAKRYTEKIDAHETPSLKTFDMKDVERVALKALFNLAKVWGLNGDQARTLLGGPSERIYYRWRGNNVSGLSKDTLERISLLLGIYKATHNFLPIKARADDYMTRPNTSFGGESAMEVMLKGRMDQLYHVQRHMDGWSG